jgi:hypothetical protein
MDMFDKIINHEKTIKQLLKKINLDDWKLALNNEQFLSFLKSYTDKNGNNIYHLLFKNDLSNDELYIISDVIDLLASFQIPAMGLNHKNMLPYDLAEKQSILATKKLKDLISQEYQSELLTE